MSFIDYFFIWVSGTALTSFLIGLTDENATKDGGIRAAILIACLWPISLPTIGAIWLGAIFRFIYKK